MSYLQVRRKRIMWGKHEVNQDLINPSTSSSFYPPSAQKDAPGTVEEDATRRTRCSWYCTPARAAKPVPSQCAAVPFTTTAVLPNQWSRVTTTGIILYVIYSFLWETFKISALWGSQVDSAVDVQIAGFIIASSEVHSFLLTGRSQ